MRNHYTCPEENTVEEKRANDVVFKHEKDGLSIYITIYNTNNNANEDSQAGLQQAAETGGQISGHKGQNADEGGQIAGNCGQNANQDSEVASAACARLEVDVETDMDDAADAPA